jgi:hypothetical protein
MVSNTRPNGTSNAFDPVSMARILRDRQIAVSFVRKGETQNARAEIAKETGINLRTVYRAIDRQLDWARENALAADTDAGQGDTPNPHSTAPARAA